MGYETRFFSLQLRSSVRERRRIAQNSCRRFKNFFAWVAETGRTSKKHLFSFIFILFTLGATGQELPTIGPKQQLASASRSASICGLSQVTSLENEGHYVISQLAFRGRQFEPKPIIETPQGV